MAGELQSVLLSGSAPPLADPNIAPISRDLELAKALTGQSLSGGSKYRTQAIGDVASGLAGLIVQDRANRELANYSAGGIGAASRALPPDHPLQKFLQSDNPMVQRIGLEGLPKALIQLGEVKDVAPGVNTQFAGGGKPTGTNPGPVSDIGKLVRDAQNAAAGGNPAGASAISQGVTKATTTPEGVPFPPARVVPNPVRTPAGPALGGAGPAAGPTFEDRAAGVGMPAAVAAAAGNKKGQEETYGAAGKALGSVIGEHIEAGGKAARDKLNALDTMESALASGGAGIMTGPHAESILKVKQTLDGLGIDTSWVKAGLPETEIISKMNAQLASASAKAMTGRPTQNEFNIWMRNNPGLATSKEGTKALIDVLRQQTNNDIELGRLAQKKSNWDDWGGTVEKFYADPAHALKNPITGKPMRDEIAAAHAGGPGAGTNPNETTAKAVPEVGQVVRGHRYVGGDPHSAKSWEAVK